MRSDKAELCPKKDNMETITEFNPSSIETDFLEKKLFQHNCNEIKNYNYEDFIIKSVNEQNAIIAGMHGQIGGDWLYIASLWINKKFRKQGLGKRLLDQAESIAIQKKCYGIYLFTYSFQSPDFYKKFGYHVFGTLENFCKNSSKIYMKKIL